MILYWERNIVANEKCDSLGRGQRGQSHCVTNGKNNALGTVYIM